MQRVIVQSEDKEILQREDGVRNGTGENIEKKGKARNSSPHSSPKLKGTRQRPLGGFREGDQGQKPVRERKKLREKEKTGRGDKTVRHKRRPAFGKDLEQATWTFESPSNVYPPIL